MNLKIKNHLLITFLFVLFFSGNLLAKPAGKGSVNRWELTLRGGSAIIISEMSENFKFLENEFMHHPGVSFDFALSRTFGKHWEPGINIGLYKLDGSVDAPYFSANGIHGSFRNLYTGIPVNYNNISNSVTFFTRYYFFEFTEAPENQLQFQPFFGLAGGMNIFATEVFYSTIPPGKDDATIFQKAGDNNGNVGQFSFELGTKASIGPRLNFIVSLNADWVNYDCVDGVHNYTEGERNHAKTLVARLMAGIVIPLSKDIYSGEGGSSSLPFSP